MLVYQTTNFMYLLKLTEEDVSFLKKIKTKIYFAKALHTDEERRIESLFPKKVSIPNELPRKGSNFFNNLEIKTHSILTINKQLKKWCDLFNQLPNYGDTYFPSAWLNEDNCTDKETIIIVAFIPSFMKSTQEGLNRIINIHLNIDFTANFVFNDMKDKKKFPELYKFKGSWKEAYLLVVKTLKEGWPQTEFPRELEYLLQK